jgi:hypothetical protein
MGGNREREDHAEYMPKEGGMGVSRASFSNPMGLTGPGIHVQLSADKGTNPHLPLQCFLLRLLAS